MFNIDYKILQIQIYSEFKAKKIFLTWYENIFWFLQWTNKT